MKTSYLSIKELAAFIGVKTDTIRRAVRKGEIPAVRVRTALRFDVHQVLHQMERNAVVRLYREDRRARRAARAARAHCRNSCVNGTFARHSQGLDCTVLYG